MPNRLLMFYTTVSGYTVSGQAIKGPWLYSFSCLVIFNPWFGLHSLYASLILAMIDIHRIGWLSLSYSLFSFKLL